MEDNNGYRCKECGMAVIIANGKILRPCGHTGTIIAGMNAVARGIGRMGGIKNDSVFRDEKSQ